MERRRSALTAVLLAIACLACLPSPTPTSPGDPHGIASPTPTATLKPTPTQWLTPTPTPTPTELAPTEITVFFTDIDAYASATPPYEIPVSRFVAGGTSLPEAVLTQFFAGPTVEEEALGLVAITSGTTGFSALEIDDGIARVYLTGPCNSGGATYTVAVLLAVNLQQFDEVTYVKVYDESGHTAQPDGPSSSIPACLEP